MAERDWAWVVLVREGVDENEVPTQVYCPNGRSFNIDALKDAARAKFVQLPANVAAPQLWVSATRDGSAEDPRTLVSTIAPNADSTLYIHAPAPPQAPAAPMSNPDLAWLRDMEDKRLNMERQYREEEANRRKEEARRRDEMETRLISAISAMKGQKGSQEALEGALGTTSLFSSCWSALQSLISTLKVRNGSSINISPTCLPTNSSGFSHRISAPGSRNASVSEAEAAPLLRERGGSSCTRRNGHSCQRE